MRLRLLTRPLLVARGEEMAASSGLTSSSSVSVAVSYCSQAAELRQAAGVQVGHTFTLAGGPHWCVRMMRNRDEPAVTRM
jgi:hypothetical protein